MLSFPPLAFALFVLSPWVLYFSSWYDATLRSVYLHEVMHVHLVLVGSLFLWPLVGRDPVPGPGRLPVPHAAHGHDAAVPRLPGRDDHGPGRAHRGGLVPLAAAGLAAGPGRRPAAGRRHPLGHRRHRRGCVLPRALRPVGAVVDEGGRARGPAARPGGTPRGREPRGAARRVPSTRDRRPAADHAPVRPRLQRRQPHARAGACWPSAPRPHPDLPPAGLHRGGDRADGHPPPRHRRHRPGDPRRRGRAGRRAWASPASSRTRSSTARRCWCSPVGPRTPGWPPGRAPRPPYRTRWTHAAGRDRDPAAARARPGRRAERAGDATPGPRSCPR